MSEEKKQREIPEIQAEYQNLCMKAGHLQYSIKCHKDDLALINDQLRELNLEAAAAQAKAQEAAKQEQPKEQENAQN